MYTMIPSIHVQYVSNAGMWMVQVNCLSRSLLALGVDPVSFITFGGLDQHLTVVALQDISTVGGDLSLMKL